MTRRWPLTVLVALVSAGLGGCDSASPTQPTPITFSPPGVATSPNPTPAANPNSVAVSGYVDDTAWRPLSGVRVEVLDGPQTGLVVLSNPTGSFVLSGEFNETTRFRASFPGHRDATAVVTRCAPCNPSLRLYFSLEPEAQPASLSGDYTLTFVADAACTTLPPEYRRRTYPVTLTPSGPNSRLVISLRAGTFLPQYDRFDAGLAGDYFAAMLGDFHGSPGIAERVDANAYLGFEGQAEARIEPGDVSLITATFAGVISYCELTGPPTSRYTCPLGSTTRVLCESNRHQFLLQR
jgi:hypothetical protein